MRTYHPIAFLLLIPFSVTGQTYTTVVNNGPSSNRVDIVVIGDGYTASQLETIYPTHVDNLVNYMFSASQRPFPRYRNFFNAHRVNIASNQSGADKPPQGVFVDTALDASYWWDGSTERLLYFNTSKANAAVNSALAGSGIDIDLRYGTVNDSKYGGGGGQWAVYAGANSSAREVALHEMGHSFGGLADEYWTAGTTYTGGEPSEPNVTRSPSTGKWDRWLGYDDPNSNIGPINYYQGGKYYESGIYRPSNNSKMRSLDRPFDAVSRERFIQQIYTEVDPLDAWQANTSPLINPLEVWVDTVDPNVIQVDWTLNGQSLGLLGETLAVASLGLGAGVHQLTALAYDAILDHSFTGDSLDWWRLPSTNLLQQSVTWTIEISAPLTGDFDGDGTYDCGDVDPLVSVIATQSNNIMFDLTGDLLVNVEDLNEWLAEAGAAQLPSAQPYRRGDANLDGSVDGSDFGVWNANKFTATAAWCTGDFTADGYIDGSDFGAWNENKFSAGDSLQVVPEPAGLFSIGVWMLAVGQMVRITLRRCRNCRIGRLMPAFP